MLHFLFFEIFPQNVGSLRPLPKKTDLWRKNKTATCTTYKIQTSHGLRVRNENNFFFNEWPIIYLFSDDFGLRSPVTQKKKAKKRYTSFVACVKTQSHPTVGVGAASKSARAPLLTRGAHSISHPKNDFVEGVLARTSRPSVYAL